MIKIGDKVKVINCAFGTHGKICYVKYIDTNNKYTVHVSKDAPNIEPHFWGSDVSFEYKCEHWDCHLEEHHLELVNDKSLEELKEEVERLKELIKQKVSEETFSIGTKVWARGIVKNVCNAGTPSYEIELLNGRVTRSSFWADEGSLTPDKSP